MEREENNHRADLTPSEKYALGQRIEEALAGRNHRPSKESVQNFAQLPQGKSSEIAAKAVDMNRETYRQAKKVVESEDREVIQ
jgi:hypothetical protein